MRLSQRKTVNKIADIYLFKNKLIARQNLLITFFRIFGFSSLSVNKMKMVYWNCFSAGRIFWELRYNVWLLCFCHLPDIKLLNNNKILDTSIIALYYFCILKNRHINVNTAYKDKELLGRSFHSNDAKKESESRGGEKTNLIGKCLIRVACLVCM